MTSPNPLDGAKMTTLTEQDVIQTCEVHGFPLDPDQLEVVTAVINQMLLSASKPAAPTLAVWYGLMPESNGKSNWTAILHRGDVCCGMTIERSEYPDRVRYEADRLRWLIGELDKEPFILDYDADKHSGYVAPVAPAQSGELVADVPEGCTVADAKMLREANHALAAENEILLKRLRPFAHLVGIGELSWAMVKYCVKDDPEKQTFQAPQMQRAFNRAAEAYRNAAPQPSQPAKAVDYNVRAKNWRDSFDAMHRRAMKAEMVVDDLAMLVRQLVHSLRKAAPGNDLADRAVDYLKRKGLAGSPLRDAAPSAVVLDDERAAFRTAVEEMVVMLENGEWAEHVAKTIAGGDELASRLETAITELHNDIGEDRPARAASPQPAQTRALTDVARDAVLEEACAAIKAEDDRESGNDYMLDSDDCIRVIRTLLTAAHPASGEKS